MAQTGIDLNLFNLLAGTPDKHWGTDELARQTGAEQALLCWAQMKLHIDNVTC